MSARSKYGEVFPGDFTRWKVEAFKSVLKDVPTNVKHVYKFSYWQILFV